ncbi:MAG: phosphoglucosamine mutase [Streptosporangiaceae bacterium]
MGRLFGTDGVRGVAGRDLTARFVIDLAAAAAVVLPGTGYLGNGNGNGNGNGGRAGQAGRAALRRRRRPVALVGRDPRASGQFLEAAVVAGLAGAGVDVLSLGVVPTPAVAYLTGALAADFGVMLSASHNPAPDNGIKFFARGGLKLPDAVEDEIERKLAAKSGPDGLPAAGFGRVTDASAEIDRYLAHLLSTLPEPGGATPLNGLRVVVDCAHGAAYDVAPRLLRRAGAEVVTIGAEPDGDNINSGCGSTSLGALSAAVTAQGADAGIAYDGDADRCLAVDGGGQVIDGDQILAVLAFSMRDEGRLAGNTVVATVMSNLGFRLAMRDAGIEVVETPVGDRYLLAAMLDGGFALGGEQSGHIIMLDHATTGDGLLTSLQLLGVAAGRGQPLGELVKVMIRYPQVLINIPGVDKSLVASSPELTDAVRGAEAELGESGRVLVRPSGTEDAVRIMVEAVDAGQARRLADALGAVVRGFS